MDRPTLEIYEARARRYEQRRFPAAAALARRMAHGVRPGGVRFDLGCGPGWYGDALGLPLVSVDAAAAMLAIVPEHAPDALRVRADLASLPFRRGAGAGAWASKAYVHLPRGQFPMALWDLHRVLEVGSPVALTMFEGDDEGPSPDDDLTHDHLTHDHLTPDDRASGPLPPGRLYSRWTRGRLFDLMVGAGFADVVVEPFDNVLVVGAVRARTLADTVRPGLRLLLVGLNPSLHAADAGYGFAGPSNRFWPALALAGIHDGARDPLHLVHTVGIGMTDVVKRATRRADELDRADFTVGMARIERLVAWAEPEAVCFVGLSGWRAAVDRRATVGWQQRGVGERPTYVMPSTSGLNAHETIASLARHLRTAWAGPDRAEPMGGGRVM